MVITDPETVEAYYDCDNDSIWNDLQYGNLMKKTELMIIEKKNEK